jgi:hypothetical protein
MFPRTESKHRDSAFPPATSVPEIPEELTRTRIVHQFPVWTPTAHEAVPPRIGKDASEAEKCLSVSAFNACGVMTRRAMHSLCREKGASGSNLFDQLKYLRDDHLITPDLWEWAEELRVLGKHGAHPEWQELSAEDAAYGIRFLREIIRYVFVNPFERSRRMLKETSKQV